MIEESEDIQIPQELLDIKQKQLPSGNSKVQEILAKSVGYALIDLS